jgi:GT2 family glycosyltransferase
MSDSSITLVVPTLGKRPDWLRDCLHSIVSQRFARCLVIVVAPSGADIDISEYPAVRVERYDEQGLSRAVNHGWGLDQQSDYISWLGDDDLLAPGSLAATAAFLDRSRQSSMVYGRVRYIDADSRSMWISRPSRFAAPYLRAGKNFVSQQGSLIRRTAADQIGWLDPGLMNAMDQDLFTRLRMAGHRAYLARELGAYRLHGNSITLLKGVNDESELVRLRHWSESQHRWYRRWRVLGHYVDRALLATMRRLPAPPVPMRDGRPYIDPGLTTAPMVR